jgi:hypothetical protein
MTPSDMMIESHFVCELQELRVVVDGFKKCKTPGNAHVTYITASKLWRHLEISLIGAMDGFVYSEIFTIKRLIFTKIIAEGELHTLT